MSISGRYRGRGLRLGPFFTEPIFEPRTIYPPSDPIFLPPEQRGVGGDAEITLHIDVDGLYPLDVVSGTIDSIHFIGRVTSNRIIADQGRLVVEDIYSYVVEDIYRYEERSRIERIDITIRGDFGTAAVRFFGGPLAPLSYTLTYTSPYFRDVEVDVDHEEGARAIVAYDIHAHRDRPARLPQFKLSLGKAYQRAGINITIRRDLELPIPTSEAGRTSRWNEQELHDSMELHWEAFANRPQWKMWVFLAKLGDFLSATGGAMFDAFVDEPGGVDRQGVAIFTEEWFFHQETSTYIRCNPPTSPAVERELFFNLMHETGHCFNLTHSWEKTRTDETLGLFPWRPPPWMPLLADPNALSWMNYPERAGPEGEPCPEPAEWHHGDEERPPRFLNASWFYSRFDFRFSDGEHFFLRHAPESLIQPGAAEAGAGRARNYARVPRDRIDHRLSLRVRHAAEFVDFGQPVIMELRLQNISDKDVVVHRLLNPEQGFIQVAVTTPSGRRVPHVPLLRTRTSIEPVWLRPGKSLYHSVNLTTGRMGFPFKEAGPYIIEASFWNVDGTAAAGIAQIWVRSPQNFDDYRTFSELYTAPLARAVYFGGSRVMDNVNERLVWVMQRLGDFHPAARFLAITRYAPLARKQKVVLPQEPRFKVLEPEPERVLEGLKLLVEQPQAAADVLGNISYHALVDLYTSAAIGAGKKSQAQTVQKELKRFFEARKVAPAALARIDQCVRELE